VKTCDCQSKIIKKCTIGLNLINKGHFIGKAVGLIGYLGFFTATNFQWNFTITFNYRLEDNLKRSKLVRKFVSDKKNKWLTGFLIRHLIHHNYPYVDTEALIKSGNLLIPCNIFMYQYKKSMIVYRGVNHKDVKYDNLIDVITDYNKIPNDVYCGSKSSDHIKNTQKLIRQLENMDKDEINSKMSVSDILYLILKYPVFNDDNMYIYVHYGHNQLSFVN
jgi:hypothetical protein